MAPPVSERLTDLLAPVVEDAGLVLEDVAVTPAGRRRIVRVVVDLPEDATGSVDLDAVAEVSRVVAEALDTGDALGESPYVLEVTSPGVDRPLTARRHWSRARGRLVTVPVAAGGQEPATEITGRVRSVDDDGVLMDVDGADRLLGWDRLGRGRVEVEFNRPDEQEA